MLCQDCREREAQVHLTQIVNNQKTSLHLCKECAAARGFHSPLDNVSFPLAEILSGLVETPSGKHQKDEGKDVVCPNCGLSFYEFTRLGRFGCGECYRSFRSLLEPVMRKIHGASLHRGKNPAFQQHDGEAAQKLLPVKEEERLRAELTKAVESEDFERAAEIRDKLKTMNESLSLDN